MLFRSVSQSRYMVMKKHKDWIMPPKCKMCDQRREEDCLRFGVPIWVAMKRILCKTEKK